MTQSFFYCRLFADGIVPEELPDPDVRIKHHDTEYIHMSGYLYKKGDKKDSTSVNNIRKEYFADKFGFCM